MDQSFISPPAIKNSLRGVRMVHRGKRSKQAMRKRLARRIVFATSFHDKELAETVARVKLTYAEKVGYNAKIVTVERGEILKDNRGRGTFQKTMPEVKSQIV